MEVDGLLAKYGEQKLLQMVRKKYRDIEADNARLEGFIELLDKVDLLATLTHDDKICLARALTTEEYGAEEPIVTEGESADCMYFLQSGTASAVKHGGGKDPSGPHTVVLKEYEAGGFFGELALSAADAKRGATVMSTSFETSVLKLPREAFVETIAINAGVAERLQATKDRYAEASARLLRSSPPSPRVRNMPPSPTSPHAGGPPEWVQTMQPPTQPVHQPQPELPAAELQFEGMDIETPVKRPAPPPEQPPGPPGLPPGWQQHHDAGSGRPYYVDPQGQSHWQLPGADPPPPPPPEPEPEPRPDNVASVAAAVASIDASAGGAAKKKSVLKRLGKGEETELADVRVREARHPTLKVVKRGWLEKKSGDTEINADGSLQKKRSLHGGGKGLRRNWSRRYFVLLSNGVLLYYKTERESSDSYRGCLVTGAGTAATEISERSGDSDGTYKFMVSAAFQPAAADASSTKSSLLLRAANEDDRETHERVHAGCL